MAKGLLIDITKCVGCGACEEACKEAHNLPLNEEKKLSGKTLSYVEERGPWYVRHMCFHCEQPTCVTACPLGALEKTKEGPVIYHPDICFGCRYCMTACPFQIPKFEWDKLSPYIRKCDMCYDRQQQGLEPACVEACPQEATIFGERDELLKIAHRRIDTNPDLYYNHIYGEHEVGGTSMLHIGPVPFKELGFNTHLPQKPPWLITWSILREVPNIALMVFMMLGGTYWLYQRRADVEEDAKKNGGKK